MITLLLLLLVISPLILLIRAEYKDGISSIKTEEKKKITCPDCGYEFTN